MINQANDPMDEKEIEDWFGSGDEIGARDQVMGQAEERSGNGSGACAAFTVGGKLV